MKSNLGEEKHELREQMDVSTPTTDPLHFPNASGLLGHIHARLTQSACYHYYFYTFNFAATFSAIVSSRNTPN